MPETTVETPQGELAYQVIAMPADTNPSGDIFGGYIMGLMDLAGGVAAAAVANGRVATVAVSNLSFHRPVKVGDVVCCYARVLRTGRTSIALQIETWVRRKGCADPLKVTAAEFIFVAVDREGRPRPLLPDGEAGQASAGG